MCKLNQTDTKAQLGAAKLPRDRRETVIRLRQQTEYPSVSVLRT
jgi:hypothetical protein